jgi:assimilatory nitrate reductase catalytic subunit
LPATSRRWAPTAPPCAYEDIDSAECILIAGSNTAVAHPIVYRRIEDAKAANPNLRIIVVDPRRTESCEIADLHLPLKPGSDIALYNAMLHVMLNEELVDRGYIAAHTEGFEALAKLVERYTPAMAAELTGLDPEAIVLAARWFGRKELRCRSTARGSTSRGTAPTTTPPSSTCIWPPARSANPAAAPSR